MRARRLASILSVCLAASVSLVAAQPKKADPKKKAPTGPVAPAKTPAPAPTPAGTGSGSAAGSGSGSGSGDVVQMTEDPPPKDMEGRDENPDAPRGTIDDPGPSITVPVKAKKAGYPIEEQARPLTLPANMSEVAIGPHAQVSPYMGSDALRARYGITRQVQLGLTYLLGAVYDDPASLQKKQGFHPGKAVGLDVTVLLQDWVGVRIGVPVYIDSPVAVSLTLGAPMKFRFGDKLALGILDDLLAIKLTRFAPSFYQDAINATRANDQMVNTIQSKGALRFSAYGVYQHKPKLALTGRLGVTLEDFATTKTDAGGGLTTFLRAGFQYTLRKYLDLGFSLGFDDLAHGGSFGPAGLLAFRI